MRAGRNSSYDVLWSRRIDSLGTLPATPVHGKTHYLSGLVKTQDPVASGLLGRVLRLIEKRPLRADGAESTDIG